MSHNLNFQAMLLDPAIWIMGMVLPFIVIGVLVVGNALKLAHALALMSEQWKPTAPVGSSKTSPPDETGG